MKKDVKKNVKTVKLAVNWDTAISDAEALIRDHQAAIAGLRDSIRVFKARRDEGDSLPDRAVSMNQRAASSSRPQ